MNIFSAFFVPFRSHFPICVFEGNISGETCRSLFRFPHTSYVAALARLYGRGKRKFLSGLLLIPLFLIFAPSYKNTRTCTTTTNASW